MAWWIVRVVREEPKAGQTERNWTFNPVLPLSPEEYASLSAALALLEEASEQEAVNLVLSNFNAYFEYSANVSNEFASLRKTELHPGLRIRSELRVRLLNWLLSLRAFLDHSETMLKRRYGRGSAEATEFKESCSRAFDQSFAYRFLYKLRNYTQHCGFPPLSISLRESETPQGRVTSSQLHFDRDELLRTYDEWGAVRQELAECPATFPVEEIMVEMMDRLEAIAEDMTRIELPFLQEQAGIVDRILDRVPGGEGSLNLAELPDDAASPLRYLRSRPIPRYQLIQTRREGKAEPGLDAPGQSAGSAQAE